MMGKKAVVWRDQPRCGGIREQYDDFEAMPAKVRLNDIVDALEMQMDEFSSFLDLDAGQVETVSRDLLRKAEECDDGEAPDLPAWQEGEWEIAKRIVSSGRFRKLPTKFEVHEWEIMRDFSDAVESEAFAKTCCTPSTAPGRSGILSTSSGGAASNRPGSRSARKP